MPFPPLVLRSLKQSPLIQRVERRIRHYAAQITRVASSAIARSCESGIPCLSSAGPPLLQRSKAATNLDAAFPQPGICLWGCKRQAARLRFSFVASGYFNGWGEPDLAIAHSGDNTVTVLPMSMKSYEVLTILRATGTFSQIRTIRLPIPAPFPNHCPPSS